MKKGVLVVGLALAMLGVAPRAGWSQTTEAATASPAATTVTAGSLGSGTAANLAADDDLYYQTASTSWSAYKTDWYGSFAGVPNTLTSLTIAYQGRNTRLCTQVVFVRDWTAGSWVQLNSQKVGTTEVLLVLSPTGTPSRYVKGTSGPGDVRVRVRCVTTAGSFLTDGDLMSISYERPVVPDELPNLVPLAPYDIRVASSDDGGLALRLSVSTANRGSYSLDLSAIPSTNVPQTSDAYQCVVWVTERKCEERRPVGTFVYHAAHNHYHFDDFALYELRGLDENGQPDMSPEGLVSPGVKASFCLLDYERDGPAPSYAYRYAYYRTCSSSSGTWIQGLSPGWRDTYRSTLAGQQIPIDGVPDGDYAVVVTADPKNRLWESSDADNVSLARISLAGGSVSVLP
jgi:hypothetical protein